MCHGSEPPLVVGYHGTGFCFVSFWFSEVVTELGLHSGMSHLLLLSGHSH